MNCVAAKKLGWLGGAVAGVCAAGVLFFCDPSRVPIYPTCVFHRLTGLDCPACGSLRALHELLHGDFISALHFNAFLVLSLPLFAWFAFDFLRREIQEQPPRKIRLLYVTLYIAAFVAFGILRDLPVPVFAAFAP
jgi:hypothetical protein